MSNSAGLHVIMDVYVEDSSVFSATKLTEMFTKLVDVLDMKILKGPDFIEVPVDPEILKKSKETGIFADEGGITGTCIISTSHLSIHAWPLQNFASIDLFSCKNFDSNKAMSFVEEFLGCNAMSTHVVHRSKPGM